VQIGCHLSISQGFFGAAKRALELGASALQVFTKNPRSLRAKKVNLDDAAQGREFCQKHNISVVVHTPYVTNLSTPKEDLYLLTKRSLVEDLCIAELFGALGAVVHCGKHVGQGTSAGRERMVACLNDILGTYQGSTKLLLENTAGQGTELGTSLADLVGMREELKFPEKLGFCFDTCHAFAAGIYGVDEVKQLLNEMTVLGYLDHLVAVHVNDSQVEYGSRKDRHANIGQGKIGLETLGKIVTQLQDVPLILETPQEEEVGYQKEIALLKNYVLLGGSEA
jgi:deoxyribonuclease-4